MSQMQGIVTVECLNSDVNVSVTQQDVDAFAESLTFIADANEHERSVCVSIDAIDIIDVTSTELLETS